jgi:hypothetical protein
VPETRAIAGNPQVSARSSLPWLCREQPANRDLSAPDPARERLPSRKAAVSIGVFPAQLAAAAELEPGFTLRTYIHLFNAAKQSREARQQLDADYGRLLGGRGA